MNKHLRLRLHLHLGLRLFIFCLSLGLCDDSSYGAALMSMMNSVSDNMMISQDFVIPCDSVYYINDDPSVIFGRAFGVPTADDLRCRDVCNKQITDSERWYLTPDEAGSDADFWLSTNLMNCMIPLVRQTRMYGERFVNMTENACRNQAQKQVFARDTPFYTETYGIAVTSDLWASLNIFEPNNIVSALAPIPQSCWGIPGDELNMAVSQIHIGMMKDGTCTSQDVGEPFLRPLQITGYQEGNLRLTRSVPYVAVLDVGDVVRTFIQNGMVESGKPFATGFVSRCPQEFGTQRQVPSPIIVEEAVAYGHSIDPKCAFADSGADSCQSCRGRTDHRGYQCNWCVFNTTHPDEKTALDYYGWTKYAKPSDDGGRCGVSPGMCNAFHGNFNTC